MLKPVRDTKIIKTQSLFSESSQSVGEASTRKQDNARQVVATAIIVIDQVTQDREVLSLTWDN